MKTPQILCSHEAKCKLGLIKWGLYVTKASLIYDIYNQAKRFTDLKVVVLGGPPKRRSELYAELENSDVQLVIVSYELYRQDIESLTFLHGNKPFDVMYLDEAHEVLTPSALV